MIDYIPTFFFLGGGDPERMAPPKVATYIENLFAKTNIRLSIISDLDVFEKDFPLFEAVNRLVITSFFELLRKCLKPKLLINH